MGKVAAFREAMFVDRTALFSEKMAGDGVNDHDAALAFFNIFFFESFRADGEMLGTTDRFPRCNIYHQRITAIATSGAIYRLTNAFIDLVNKAVNFFGVFLFEPHPKLVVFFFPPRGNLANDVKVSYDCIQSYFLV